MSTFGLNVSYGQVAVFDVDLQKPFNDWRDEHVAQGFAWRPGSVSFQTLEQDGLASVTVRKNHAPQVREDATRVIAVPFHVPDSGLLEVASIGDRRRFAMEAGEYRLVFEHGLGANKQMWCEFTFIPVATRVRAEILRGDGDLAPPERLLMEADPA